MKENKTNWFAIAGFICSFFATITGLVISIIAYKQIKRTNEYGKGFAVAGIIISSVYTVLRILLLVLIIFVFGDVYKKEIVVPRENIKLVYNSEKYIATDIDESVTLTLYGEEKYLNELASHEEFFLTLDMSDCSDNVPCKAYYIYDNDLGIDYEIEPRYDEVTLKRKIQSSGEVEYVLKGEENLNGLEVERVNLRNRQVLYYGTNEDIKKVDKLKTEIEIDSLNITDEGSYYISNLKAYAYDKNGNLLKDITVGSISLSADVLIKKVQ